MIFETISGVMTLAAVITSTLPGAIKHLVFKFVINESKESSVVSIAWFNPNKSPFLIFHDTVFASCSSIVNR